MYRIYTKYIYCRVELSILLDPSECVDMRMGAFLNF